MRTSTRTDGASGEGDAESQTRAVGDAARHSHFHGAAVQRFAGAVTVSARFGPRFAAAAAARAGGSHRHVDWDDQPARRFEFRERDFGAQHVGVIAVRALAEKTIARTFHASTD
jgi:hypothetical protein